MGKKWADKSVGSSMRQWVSKSASQPVSQFKSVNQTVSQSLCQLLSKSVKQSVSQLVRHLDCYSIGQLVSLCQSVNWTERTTLETVNQSIHQSVISCKINPLNWYHVDCRTLLRNQSSTNNVAQLVQGWLCLLLHEKSLYLTEKLHLQIWFSLHKPKNVAVVKRK